MLSNGQRLGMYYIKQKNRFFYPSSNFNVWKVGLAIGNTKRQCNDWFVCKRNKRKKKIDLKSTGDVGLEGLIIAFRSIKRLIEKVEDGDYVVVSWGDNKRMKAYKYLLRIGFEYGRYDDYNCFFIQKGDVH